VILKKPTLILIALSLISILILAVPQSALAVPGFCPSGYTYIAKFNWNGPENPGPDGWYPENGDTPGVVWLIGDDKSGTWESNVLISVMVMTDGRNQGGGDPLWGEKYYNPPTKGPEPYDHSLMGYDDHGNLRDISNLVFCGSPYPVTLASFAARANRGTVTIDWITATEINTTGFLLYRSTTADGPQVQLTENLIAAQGSGVTGASYRVTDTPGYGIFYYWLRDVDYSGQSSLHGPIIVNVLPAIRQPVSLPSLPGQ